jgi:hypothetical protein
VALGLSVDHLPLELLVSSACADSNIHGATFRAGLEAVSVHNRCDSPVGVKRPDAIEVACVIEQPGASVIEQTLANGR